MAVVEVISKLSNAEISEKQEHYLNIVKLFSDSIENTSVGLNDEHIKSLCSIILCDLKKETNELPHLMKLMQLLFHNKHLQKFLPELERIEIIKSIISIVDSSQHENILVNCFSVLIQISPFILENTLFNELLERMEEILSKKNDAASTYSICCFFQRILKDYEERLSNFIPVLSKLVFLPLCHPSTKVREIAEKTLDMFPKLLLYTSDEEASSYLVKLVKEVYTRSLLLLFKEKQELYALKVCKHVINALGSALYANLQGIMPFFTVLEKGFKSPIDDVCIASFNAWKSLINSMAASDGALNESKILRFTLKPFKNVSRLNENIVSVVCDTWWHLAWNLAEHLSNRFSEVCIPLLELTVGKITNGHPEKTFPKGGPISKGVRKCCFMLLRFLEQPPSDSFNRISSPKKLPNIPYPTLQIPLDIKIITHHFKEILHAFKIIIDVCGTKEDMKLYLDCLMKSVLFIVSTQIEDSNKDSVEAVTQYLNFLSSIIEAKSYPSLLCLKCLESLSKLSRKVLVSHCFNCGSRKSQDILCTNLLKLLLNPYLFPSEAPKRFFAAYNRFVQAGLYESFHALSITHKFMHIIRNAIGGNSFNLEVLIDVWSGIATPLLEVIEKTQEVNQGDKQEHDFSCMYDVLLFPFEFIFPVYIHQFRTRPAFKLWTNLYKAFIRSASLVTTTTNNEASENFCCKLKDYLKEDLLKKPHFFETVCLFMQIVIESIDFSTGSTSGNQGIMDVALMIKRKKPLGNLTSFVDLLSIILKAYYAHYIEIEDDSTQSSAPAIQRRLHIVKSAAPLDIIKIFFGNLKSGSIISFVLEQLADPISKLFLKSREKRNIVNHIDSKLELVWNVLSSSIERYYLGPYDSEFLNLMSPLLEATFSHPKRHIKEKSRRFWFATFGPNASSLQFPDSLKTLLKKMKLPLLPDDISPTEFSISPMPDTVSEDNIIINPSALPKPAVMKSQPFKSPVAVNGEVSKAVIKENKQSPKISIDDLPSEEFVKIESSIVTTPKRRGIRKRKSYVPTLYNDLSQDTSTVMSLSESQDTVNSASLEVIEMKETEAVIETKATSTVELMNSMSTTFKDDPSVSKSAVKSPMSAKFEEKLNKNLKYEQISKEEVIIIDSSESDTENNNKNKEKKFKTELMSNKISVFSEPTGKQIRTRNTRRNTRLSQSFSGASTSKEQEKLEFQKNKSCSELINISDSEEIIPSSQSSTENENSVKLSVGKNKPLSVEDGHQKSLSIEDFNKDIELLPPVCLLPNRENTDEASKDEFAMKNDDAKIISSTSSKSKTDAFEKLHENKDKKEINVTSNFVKDKDDAIACNTETLNKEPENTKDKPVLDESSDIEVCRGTNDVIKDLNFLLDAVDDIMKISPTESNEVSPQKNTPVSSTDVEMEDISVSEAEASVATSNLPEEKTDKINVKEPVAKKSRISLKLAGSDSSQYETYTQRLRKKNSNIEVKFEPNLKRKKPILKVSTSGKDDDKNIKNNITLINKKTELTDINSNKQVINTNKDIKSDMCQVTASMQSEGIKPGRRTMNSKKNGKNSESQKKENIQSRSISGSKESTNFNKNAKNNINNTLSQNEILQLEIMDSSQGNDLEESKIDCKQGEEKSEKTKLNVIEAGHSEENSLGIATKMSIEISASLNDVKIITASNDQTIQCSESCEIFETLSENSCKDPHNKDMCDDLALADSNGLDDSELITKESKFTSDSQVVEESDSSCHVSANNTNESSLKDVNEEKFEENITIIPSSLDSDDNLDTLNKINALSNKANCAGENTSLFVATKSANLTPLSSSVKSTVDVQNTRIKSDPLSVQFSDTEDDISFEMQNIVNSIVDASCENSISSLPESKLTSSEQSRASACLQFSSVTVSKETDVDSVSIDEKSDSHQTEQKENDMKDHGTDKELCQSSEDSETAFKIDLSGVIMLSTECEPVSSVKILENSCAIDVENIDSSVEKNDNMQSYENLTNSKIATDDKTVSETYSVKFAPELDHSYSISEHSDKLVDSHTNESDIKRDEITNTVQSCEIEDMNIRCSETPENIELSQEKVIEISEINVLQSEINLLDMQNSADKKNVDSSDYLPLVISGSSIPTNEIFTKSSISVYNEDEIKCVIKELIVQVDKLSGSWIDAKIRDSVNNSTSCSSKAAMENFIPLNSKSVANKDSQLLISSSDDNLAKGSKKRKIKPPIRSPINFRQRGKIENSRKLSIKSIKSLSVPQIKSMTEDKELVIKSLFPKVDMKEDENTESSMAKIISSIVDSITGDDGMESEVLPNVPSSSQMTKAQRIELSNDELTDLNTRLNASIAPQTRRSKMIAASHKTSAETETESMQSDVVIVCTEDSSSNLSSILKKRKSKTPLPPAKVRKVTFASPLIHEVVIENCSESRGIETVTMNRLKNWTKKRKKILQEKTKTEKPTSVQPSVPTESEDVPSSSEYQDSDVLDFSNLPVSPALINCPDDVSNIVKHLTSPSWVRGLESLLFSKNIQTIGDVCKLNIHQVKALPFKSPKVFTLHKALMAYIDATQENTLEKLKTIDDGSFVRDTDAATSSFSEDLETIKPEISDDDTSKLLEETLKDILKKDHLKELPVNLLGQLVEACGKAIIEKSEQKS